MSNEDQRIAAYWAKRDIEDRIACGMPPKEVAHKPAPRIQKPKKKTVASKPASNFSPEMWRVIRRAGAVSKVAPAPRAKTQAEIDAADYERGRKEAMRLFGKE